MEQNFSALLEVKNLLSNLLSMTRDMNLARTLEGLLNDFILKMIDIMGTQAAVLFSTDGMFLSPKVLVGSLQNKIRGRARLSIGKGIAGWAAGFNNPVIVNEPYSHPRFLEEFDMESGFIPKNILCAPIIIDGKLKGLVEVLNKKTAGFNDLDVDLIKVFTSMIEIALKNDMITRESRKWKNYYETILENIPSGFIGVLTDKRILFFNNAAEKILGTVNASFIGRSFEEVLSKFPTLVKIINSVLVTNNPANRQETEILKMNNQKIRLGYGTIVLRDYQDKIIGHGIIFQDLTPQTDTK